MKKSNKYRGNNKVKNEMNMMALGGNPYGGYSPKDLYDYLFNDDEEQKVVEQQKQLEEQGIQETEERQQNVIDEDSDLAMQIATGDLGDNPYNSYNFSSTAGMGAPSGFRSFLTPEQGKQALLTQLELYKTGKTKNPVKPTSSLLEAMSVYAPKSDGNNPEAYADFIAKKLGVSKNTPISAINTELWANAITQMEGNKSGNNPGNLRN